MTLAEAALFGGTAGFILGLAFALIIVIISDVDPEDVTK